MEQTQTTVQRLRQEIRSRQEQLEALQREEVKKGLTDIKCGIECLSVDREGMGENFGKHFNKHVRGTPQQDLYLTFAVLTPAGRVMISVVMQASMTDDDDVNETTISVEGVESDVNTECPWLYRPAMSDEEIDEEYGEDIAELAEECDKVFDALSPEVKKCMDFLREKREVLDFIY